MVLVFIRLPHLVIYLIYILLTFCDNHHFLYYSVFVKKDLNLESNSLPLHNFTIRARAKDVTGYISDWSTIDVTMPKNKALNISLFFQRFFQRFPFFEKILNQII
jgi:hypothetical protein